MNWGLDMDKLLLIGLVAVVIIGPDRLPKAAETFAKVVRRAGEYLRDTRSKMKDELGPDIDDVDWRKLDPRQYDPRRIIRDALLEEPTFDSSPAASSTTVMTEPAAAAPDVDPLQLIRSRMGRPVFTRETPPPFDVEAT